MGGGAPAEDRPPLAWGQLLLNILGLCVCLYFFLVGLAIMGDAFKVLGGSAAGEMFGSITNPIAGLMVGILATVLVQSSSTSTSIIVSLAGSGQIAVKDAIPIIMGANIGTSVTSTIVSMGQMGVRKDLERSFAGATVHDMFNWLAVLVLLPVELLLHPIYHAAVWITARVYPDDAGSKSDSPIKILTKPLTSIVLSTNKYLIYSLSLGLPPLSDLVHNVTVCPTEHLALVGLGATMQQPDALSWMPQLDREKLFSVSFIDSESTPEVGTRALLSQRKLTECPHVGVYCISSPFQSAWKKLNPAKDSHKYSDKFWSCDTNLDALEAEKFNYRCGNITAAGDGKSSVCMYNTQKFYEENVVKGDLIKGGIVDGIGDAVGGTIALAISMVFLIGGLIFLVKFLNVLVLGSAKKALEKAVDVNDYLAILIGAIMTFIVQSSSVTTSVLTPLVGIGVLPLAKMLPLTLGANIGTCGTGLVAAFASPSQESIQVGFCHLLFNLFGIIVWFPVPFMRRMPIAAAQTLGMWASFQRWVPVAYILVAFVAVPALAMLVSVTYTVNVVAGVIVTLVLLGGLASFVVWWNFMGGCYKLISEEDRAQAARENAEEGACAGSSAIGTELGSVAAPGYSA